MNYFLSHTDMVGRIFDCMRASGFAGLPKDIKFDGHIHRFSSSGKRNDTAGWYVFFRDPYPAGVFGCWRSGITQSWRFKKKRSKEAEKQYRHQIRAAKKLAQIEKAKDQKQAKMEAERIWNTAWPVHAGHPYLIRKGIYPYGIKEYHGDLVIPLYDETKSIVNIQWILPKKTDAGLDKFFLKGGKKKGCYFLIGAIKEDQPLCICEGYATGVSIHENTGYTVAVAFDAGNLKPVSFYFRQQHPSLKIVICADDDYKTEGNPGLSKAKEAAKLIGAAVAIPKFPSPRPDGATDFNDLHQIRRGIYGR